MNAKPSHTRCCCTTWLTRSFLAACFALLAPCLSAVDVRSCGAVGDGQTDDTAAIQKAVNTGGGVHFSGGVYRLTRTVTIELEQTGFIALTVDGTARVVMAGPGPAFRFIGTHAGTAAPESFKDNVWERQRTPMVDGLEIVGAHLEASGVEAQGTMQLTLTRLTVRRALHGVHLVGRNRNVIVANSHLYDNHGVGLFLDDVDLHQINVASCHISYNAQGGIVSRKGNVRNLHISGCDIESNMSPDTPATANVLIDCTGSPNGAGEIAITGCTLQHNSKSPGSANIRIVGRSNSSPGQPLVREGNVTLTGNVLSDVRVNVHLKDCRGVTLNGNTFWMGYDHHLLVENSASIVIGPNNLDRNPRYAYGNAAQACNAVVIRNSEDCTLTGLHLTGVHADPAAVLIENCRRFNLAGCTILDSDGPGLLLRNVSNSLVTGCLIRDDRPERQPAPSLRVEGGLDNVIANNLLAHGSETASASATPAADKAPAKRSRFVK